MVTYGLTGGGSGAAKGKSSMTNLAASSGVGHTQPPVGAAEAIRLRRLGYTQRPDGTWQAPRTSAIRDPDGNSVASASSSAWDGSSNSLGSMRSSQTNNAPRPSQTIASTSGGGGGMGGGGAMVTPASSQLTTSTAGSTPAAALTPVGGTAPGDNAYLNSLLGGAPSDIAGQYTANATNDVLQNPDVLSRGVLRNMGISDTNGYGGVLSQDIGTIAPIVAYLMGQGGQGDPNSTLNTIGQLAQNRSVAGGGGAMDESLLNQILNPTGQLARSMVGLGNGSGAADLKPADQMKAVNPLLGAAIDAGLNPWAGQATAQFVNSAGTGYQDTIARGGAAATNPYVDYLRQQGLGSMFGF